MPAMATIEPPLALSSGHAARQSRTWAKNFSSKPASQSASVSAKKSPRRAAPALLTRISSRPKRVFREARQAAPARLRRTDRRREFRRVRPLRADSVRDLAERVLIARGEQNDRSRQLGELKRDALADAAARAGHQRDLALQFRSHRSIDCGTPESSQPASAKTRTTAAAAATAQAAMAWPRCCDP